jgi:anti-sigma-K factor RskA
MPDSHSPEDEALLYVLGELTAEQRREFELRMAESAELRQIVRELEEGMVALTTGLPRRRPPAEIWSSVEKTVSRRANSEAILWRLFWRNGWAAAGLCAVGWLLNVFFLSSGNKVNSPTRGSAPPREPLVANVSTATDHSISVPKPPTNGELQLLHVRAEEINDLRLKLTAMAEETNALSQLLAQERARLAETNRMKFYQFTSALAAGTDAPAPQLSPAMQRAVLISIGRELGLLPSTVTAAPGNGRPVTTVNGIDFVDLRPQNIPGNQPATQPPANPPSQPRNESQLADSVEPSIPTYTSGDKLVVGLDPTVVPTNSAVTLSIAAAGAATPVASWDFAMGQNPTMVTVPIPTAVAFSLGGLSLTVNSVNWAGVSNVLQFVAPATP